MNLTIVLLVFFLRLLDFSAADSATFELKLYAPDTILSEASIYIGDDDKIYIANNTDSVSGYIANNGSLIIDNAAVGIGKNYLSLSADSQSFTLAVPFSIADGFLKLYGNDFHAVPSGEQNIYVIGNANAHAGQDDVIPVAVKAVEAGSSSGSSSSTISSFTGNAVTTSQSFSVLDISQTFKTGNGGSHSQRVQFSHLFLILLTYLF